MNENNVIATDGVSGDPAVCVGVPVFLVGAERSGSTMLRLMLADHPEVCWLNEFEYVVDQVSDSGEFPDLSCYREWLSCHRQFTGTRFEIDDDLNYRQLVNSFLVQRKQRKRASFVGATVHRHFDRLLNIWPDAKFIHIIRDPRDVARSVIKVGWEGHTYHGVNRWMDAERTWSRLLNHISSDRYVEIWYERLLEDPQEELLPAWQLIGADPAQYVMKYHETSSYSQPDPSLGFQWRRKASSLEVQLIEYRVGSLLSAKGYEPSGYPPIHPSWLTRLKYGLQNRWGRAMRRRRLYGTTMWLANMVVQRLSFKALRQTVRRKMIEIERRRLK